MDGERLLSKDPLLLVGLLSASGDQPAKMTILPLVGNTAGTKLILHVAVQGMVGHFDLQKCVAAQGMVEHFDLQKKGKELARNGRTFRLAGNYA